MLVVDVVATQEGITQLHPVEEVGVFSAAHEHCGAVVGCLSTQASMVMAWCLVHWSKSRGHLGYWSGHGGLFAEAMC